MHFLADWLGYLLVCSLDCLGSHLLAYLIAYLLALHTYASTELLSRLLGVVVAIAFVLGVLGRSCRLRCGCRLCRRVLGRSCRLR